MSPSPVPLEGLCNMHRVTQPAGGKEEFKNHLSGSKSSHSLVKETAGSTGLPVSMCV